MSLLDELKQQKAEIAERLERACADVQYFDGRMADLLLAIAALSPPPAEPEPGAVLAGNPPEPGADPVMLAAPESEPLPLPDPEPAFAEPQDRYRFSPFAMFRRETEDA